MVFERAPDCFQFKLMPNTRTSRFKRDTQRIRADIRVEASTVREILGARGERVKLDRRRLHAGNPRDHARIHLVLALRLFDLP